MRLRFDPAAVDGTPEGVKGRRQLGGFGSVGGVSHGGSSYPAVEE